MEKYLLLKGCAGLGNRLLTLISAAVYAKKNNRTLIVDWNDGLYFSKEYNFFSDYFKLNNVKYLAPQRDEIRDLFDNKNLRFSPHNFELFPDNDIYEEFEHFANPLGMKIHGKLPKYKFLEKLGGIWLDTKNTKKGGPNNFLSYLKCCYFKNSFAVGGNLSNNHKTGVLVFADYIPKVNNYDLINILSLQPTIELRISQIGQEIEIQNCIGVHVRSTDLKPTKEISVLIKDLKQNHNDANIFLATDNHEIEKLFNLEFKNLRQYKKDLPSNENIGLHQSHLKDQNYIDASIIFESGLIDMILLSKTMKLYFQGNSTFSILSSKLKKQENSINWLNLQ